MDIIEDLKRQYKYGGTLIKLIYINVAVFIAISIVSLITYLVRGVGYDISDFFAFPSNMHLFLLKPWTIFTYMFIHAGIWHILFNLLWLYWFGQIFLQYLTQKQLLFVYISGGIVGALLYALAYNISPAFDMERFGSSLVGASGAIMAIVIAISAIVPDYSINLLLFGKVKLKYIALFTIILDILSIQSSNAGGHIAHLGGALWGYIYAVRYRSGKDFSKVFITFFSKITGVFKRRPKMKVSYKKPSDDKEYLKTKAEMQKETDRILDKIAKGGYGSLTNDEKDFLFRQSNR
ncbi:MAG TPA: rhomboid family intramembrane serine protease [Bacteroidales bacterium]|nr:rhomboid family intramembrane serine protease [Bacteroidales bacterium]